MHTPSMLGPIVANEIAADHARHARDARSVRGLRSRRATRRQGASPGLLPRGRVSPPLAH